MDAPPRYRTLPWVLTLLALGLAIRLAISFQDLDFQVNYGPLVDDAFYSLKIAKNLAAGHGFTFDGIHRTNGFQPLYVFLMVPVFRLVPDEALAPLQSALVILSIFNIAAAFLLFRIVNRAYGGNPALLALGIFCLSPYVIENGMSGLETTIAAFFMLACLDFYLARIRGRERAWKNDLLFALLIALLVFSRIDGALFALALGLDYLRYRTGAGGTLLKRLGRMSMIAAASLAIYSPWLVFSIFHFGAALPESGAAVRYISQLYGSHLLFLDFPPFEPGSAPAVFYLGNLQKTLHVLAQHPAFFPATTLSYILKVTGILTRMFFLDSWPVHLFFVAAGIALFRMADEKMDGLIFFILIFLAAYNLYQFGFWFFYRYFYPVEIIFIVMGAGIFKWMDEKLRRKNFRALLPITAALFILIFAENAIRMFGQTDDFNIRYYYRLAEGIDRLAPPRARVGTFQAGTMGYFSSRTVVNLDGVVNPDALDAMKAGRFLAYIKEERLDYIIDEPNVIRLILFRTAGADPSGLLVKISGPDMPFELYEVRPD